MYTVCPIPDVFEVKTMEEIGPDLVQWMIADDLVSWHIFKASCYEIFQLSFRYHIFNQYPLPM
jgi:hypothetical protein